jgi:hypothetical protein
MFFTKLIINNENEIEKEDDGNSVCVVGSLRSTISDNTESIENNDGIFEMDEDQTLNKTETKDSSNQTTIDEKINEDDEDENKNDKLYVISIDNIPYYYEQDLISARAKMWSLGTNIMKETDNDDFTFNPRCIFANNCQNKISVVSQYSFLGFYYNHTICELEINYVVKE